MIFYTKSQPRLKRIGIIAPNANVVYRRITAGIISSLQENEDFLVGFTTIERNDDVVALESRVEAVLSYASFDCLFTIGKTATTITKYVTELHRTYTPIVFGGVVEPEKSGLIKNKSFSGNHLTGLESPPKNYAVQIKKILDLLKASNLSVDTVALLFNPATTPEPEKYIDEVVMFCRTYRINVIKVNTSELDSVERTLTSLRERKCIAIALRDSTTVTNMTKISAFCIKLSIPLTASDLESVSINRGASLGFGDSEASIGSNMVNHALPILTGNSSPANTPIQTLPWNEKICISKNTAEQQKLHLDYSSRYITKQKHIIPIT